MNYRVFANTSLFVIFDVSLSTPFWLCCFQVTSIALELGSRESRCAVLVWSGGGGEAATSKTSFVSYGLKSPSKEDQFEWDDLQIVSKIK